MLAGWQQGALIIASRGGASSGSHFRKMFWSLSGGISGSTGITAWPRVNLPPSGSLLLVPRAGLAQVGGHLVFAVGSDLGEGASVYLFESHKRLLALEALLGIDG